jgi:hypothetical protein
VHEEVIGTSMTSWAAICKSPIPFLDARHAMMSSHDTGYRPGRLAAFLPTSKEMESTPMSLTLLRVARSPRGPFLT